jgi:hypothetical protein
METKNDLKLTLPPRIIPTITAGFNTITNNIQLIILPIFIDLLLWFGPRISLKQLFDNYYTSLIEQISAFESNESIEILKTGQEIWNGLIENFNALSIIRSYPIGVSSLFSSAQPIENPIGNALLFEVPSFGTFFLIFLALSIIGLLLGSIYFSEMARVSQTEVSPFSLKRVLKQYFQIILLTIILFICAMVISFPSSIMLSIVTLIAPAIAQFSLFVMVLILFWLLLPLVFSAHGIFINDLRAASSILTSLKVVRFSLPNAGLFLLTALLINYGMNIIWRIPPGNSWMAFIGICGHAFISTALITSSFIFYQKGADWLKNNPGAFQFRTKKL